MKLIETNLKDCFVIEMPKFGDERGFFLESFNSKKLKEAGITFDVKQVNFATSQKNVLRGLHFQESDAAQAKIVGVISGAVLDVVVDYRKESPTFLKHFKLVIDTPEKFLIIPRGFAHGYYSLADQTIFHYAVDNYYAPQSERGLRYDDPALAIDWDLKVAPIVSKKDLQHRHLTI